MGASSVLLSFWCPLGNRPVPRLLLCSLHFQDWTERPCYSFSRPVFRKLTPCEARPPCLSLFSAPIVPNLRFSLPPPGLCSATHIPSNSSTFLSPISFFLSFFVLIYLRKRACIHTSVHVHMQRSEDNLKKSVLFYHTGHKD